MAAIATAEIPQAQREELMCTYAALILHDEKMDVTADNIAKLVKAAGGAVEPFMPVLFARALSGVNVADLLSFAGTVGAAVAAAPAGAVAGAGGAAAEAPKEEEKEEEPEEEEDMGFSLFD